MGLSGRVPWRVDAATKAGLLDLLEQAVGQGWTVWGLPAAGPGRAALLPVAWPPRRRRLADQAPGGSPMHGLLDWEVAEIVWLFGEWARSTARLASSPTAAAAWNGSGCRHRRSAACWPASGCGCGRCPARPAGPQAVPDWVKDRPGSIWIYDTTHSTGAGVAATMVEDPVSRTWLAEVVSAEQTSTQSRSWSPTRWTARACWIGSAPATTAWSTRPWTTRPGRPGTPTDRAWIESLFGHVKAEHPHLNAIRDPAALGAELAVPREHDNGVRLHAGIG